MLQLVKQGMDYISAPLAPAFWEGHINDFALVSTIQRGKSKGILTIRLWRTPYQTAQGRIFVGVTREYEGIQWGLLHHISPDVDTATDLLVKSLKTTGRIHHSCKLPLVKPMIGEYLIGERFFTHGELRLLYLIESAEVASPCLSQESIQ